jgi:hypothetical protein
MLTQLSSIPRKIRCSTTLTDGSAHTKKKSKVMNTRAEDVQNVPKPLAVSLDYVIEHASNAKVRFHYRHAKYKFGVSNYGEFDEWLNEADKCLWDAFAPGYTRVLKLNRKYKVKRITGIICIEDGNHKIGVELYVPGFDASYVEDHARRYASQYSEFTRKSARWIPAGS